MYLQYFYDKSLAHASYLIGCQKTGEALVIDPGRDVAPYLHAAEEQDLRIVGAAETHIHADFVSGSRELADRCGARMYLSDEGPAEWKYAFATPENSQLLKDGDSIRIGNVRLDTIHTPGHTPESISFLLTDAGGGATSPMGIFTGDFVFVGSIGRPDLLETAAGVAGSAETGARDLYRSMRRFRELPDHWQVWPAHGAGSACGKGLGAIPTTTVGYEKLFNPALQFDNEQKFVDYILDEQPETPPYFAVMKRINKFGPPLVRELSPVERLPLEKLTAVTSEYLVIDTSPAKQFAQGHVPETINIPAPVLVAWAGFFVDYNRPVYLITSERALGAELRGLRSIGVDHVAGWFDAAAVGKAGLATQSYGSAAPQDLQSQIERGDVEVLDVRSHTEFQQGHIPNARHRFLGNLLRELPEVDRRKRVVVHCLGGRRSAIAASILQRAGFNVTDLRGGYQAWVKSDLPTITG